MYENDYMYAVERNGKYLAHYGIRGMKWGVRKAIASGNSAKLSKQYAKAQKKLAKLEKQAGKSKKYAKRAALLGAGAAAAGGLAAAGTEGVGTAMRKVGGFTGRTMSNLGSAMAKSKNSKIRKAGLSMRTIGNKANGQLVKAGFGVQAWGKSNSLSNAAAKKFVNLKTGANGIAGPMAFANGRQAARASQRYATQMNQANKAVGGITNNTIARIGAGAVGAGLAVGAARNAYKAATAKKKAEKFRAAMNESFKGTKYANGGGQSKPRQGKKRRR